MSGEITLVTVVLPAHCAADSLDAQIEVLGRFVKATNITVVDDGLADAAASLLQSAGVRLIRSSGRGVGAARNSGVASCDSGFVLLCDSDDLVEEGWVESHVAALRQGDVSGGPLNHGLLNTRRGFHACQAITELPTAIGDRHYAVGANMGFRREVWERIGGFDEKWRGGAEDIDFCWRAQAAGFKLVFAPDAVVHYRHRSTYPSMVRQAFFYGRGDARLRRRYGMPFCTYFDRGTAGRPASTMAGAVRLASHAIGAVFGETIDRLAFAGG